MRADQLCIDTICWNVFPLERALAGIAEIGIPQVELCASLGTCDHAAPESFGRRGSDKLLGLLDKYGLQAVCYSGQTDITTAEGMVAGVARLQMAADLDIPLFVTPLPPSGKGPEAAELAFNNAVLLADLAGQLGIELCIETGLWGFGVCTGEDYVGLLERMDRPNVRINFDAAATTLFNAGAKPTKDDIAVLAPYLAHFHLCDRASTELGKWDFRPIGEGVIDWDPLLGELDSVGFTGNVSVELGWEVVPETPEIVDDAVRRSIQFVGKHFQGS
jgi:sugar phosphate isomerase/epimerase